MNEAKLLVVNLQDPTKTKYMSPRQIALFLLGRRISNYPILKVQDGSADQIVITWGGGDIEKQLTEAIRSTQEDN